MIPNSYMNHDYELEIMLQMTGSELQSTSIAQLEPLAWTLKFRPLPTVWSREIPLSPSLRLPAPNLKNGA